MAKTIKLEAAPPTGRPPEKPVMPRPAALRPGVGGSPPLPVGQPATVADGVWRPAAQSPAAAHPVIKEMRDSVETAARTLPVDPNTPPVRLDSKMIALEDTTPEKQAEVNELLTQTAIRSEVGQRVASTPLIKDDPSPPERPATRTAIDPNYQPPPPQTTRVVPAELVPESRPDSVKTQSTICPNCHFDLAQGNPDPEPVQQDKINFLQATLGQRAFTKVFSVFNGSVMMEFRTLSIGELDALFKEVYRERDNGTVTTTADFFERVARLRLYLQLQRVRSNGFFDHELPDGLTPELSPNASAYWELPGGGDQLLPKIETYIMSKVLPNESLFRVVLQQAGRFNRLVAKLEVLSSDDSFWKATG